VPVDIFAGETLREAFARLNPARTTPVLELADGRTLPESAAILVYLAEGTPLLPADALDRAQAIRWLVYEQADVVPAIGGLRFRLLTGRLRSDDAEAERRRRLGEAVLRLLDHALGRTPFLVGTGYSIADIAVYGYVHVAGDAGYDLSAFPHLSAWLARVRAQPGHVDDLEPYPANADPGAGRSVYDA